MKQVSITFDGPAPIKNTSESLAVSLGLTRVRKGEEQANVSIIIRMLLEMAIGYEKEFSAWLQNHRNNEPGQVVRSTIQATDEFVAELESCARKNNLLRRDDGQLVPNLTMVIIKLLEFSVSDKARLKSWFAMCVDEGLG